MFWGLVRIMVGFRLVYQSQVGVGPAKKLFYLNFTLHHANLNTYTVQVHVQQNGKHHYLKLC